VTDPLRYQEPDLARERALVRETSLVNEISPLLGNRNLSQAQDQDPTPTVSTGGHQLTHYASIVDLHSNGAGNTSVPQSMQDTSFREASLRPSRPSERPRWKLTAPTIKSLLLAALVATVLGSLFFSSWKVNHPLYSLLPASDQDEPAELAKPGELTDPSWINDDQDDPSQCHATSTFLKVFKYSDLDAFTLRNLIRPRRLHGIAHERVEGSIRLIPAPASQKEDVVVSFAFDTNDANLQSLLQLYTDDSSFVVNYPKDTDDPPPPTEPRPCIHTRTIVSIGQKLTLQNLTLESNIISISVNGNIGLDVTHTTHIRILGGIFSAEPLFKSRVTDIQVDAGSVYGSYPLYDGLSINSIAGSTAIDVLPQPAGEIEHPAVFLVDSTAGSINVNYPPDSAPIPARKYQTKVTSLAGSISGRYLHGNATFIATTAGRLDVEVVPYVNGNSATAESTLITSTKQGDHHVSLRPHGLSGSPAQDIGQLRSQHTSDAANLRLEYPAEWTGHIEAESTAGAVDVGGRGVEIVRRQKKGPVGSIIEAKKGSGNSTILAQTLWGRVDFRVRG
jgi:hypothetical protein